MGPHSPYSLCTWNRLYLWTYQRHPEAYMFPQRINILQNVVSLGSLWTKLKHLFLSYNIFTISQLSLCCLKKQFHSVIPMQKFVAIFQYIEGIEVMWQISWEVVWVELSGSQAVSSQNEGFPVLLPSVFYSMEKDQCYLQYSIHF